MNEEPGEAMILTATDVAIMVGCRYEAVFRYLRELEDAGVRLEAVNRGNVWWFSLADVEILRRHHERKPRVRRFGKPGGHTDLRREVLGDLKLLANNLLHFRRRVAGMVKVVERAAPSSLMWIGTLPPGNFKLARPIPVNLIPEGELFTAVCVELELSAEGETRTAAVAALRKSVAANYAALARAGEALRGAAAQRWEEFQAFVTPEVGKLLVSATRLGSGPASQYAPPETAAWKDFGFSTRVAGALVRAGITNLDQLVARRDELPTLTGLGPTALRSIDTFLLKRSPGRDTGERWEDETTDGAGGGAPRARALD